MLTGKPINYFMLMYSYFSLNSKRSEVISARNDRKRVFLCLWCPEKCPKISNFFCPENNNFVSPGLILPHIVEFVNCVVLSSSCHNVSACIVAFCRLCSKMFAIRFSLISIFAAYYCHPCLGLVIYLEGHSDRLWSRKSAVRPKSAVKLNKSPATWDWWRVVWLFISGGLLLVSSSPSD